MGNRVAGKVAIVTGASRGVGLEDAKILVREGAQVVMTDVLEEDGQRAAEALGDSARFIKQDVGDEQGWKDLIATVERDYGRLDILVNNAAILRAAGIEEETLEGYRKMQRVNAEGVFLGMQAALPLLEKSGGGSIVNMSSVAAHNAMPHFFSYGASKAAVKSMTQMVAVHCHKKENKVRCNSIHPDGIVTPMVMDPEILGAVTMTDEQTKQAAGYACMPEEVAETVLFLASDDSRGINGAAINMDKSSSVTPPYL